MDQLSVLDGEYIEPQIIENPFSGKLIYIHIDDLRNCSKYNIGWATFRSEKKLVNTAHLIAFYKYMWRYEKIKTAFWSVTALRIVQGSKYTHCGIGCSTKLLIKGTMALYNDSGFGISACRSTDLKERYIDAYYVYKYKHN